MITLCELYKSIQGESRYTGLPCIIVRTAGCNLNCRWCDTLYARSGGEERSIDSVMRMIERLGACSTNGARRVSDTGVPSCRMVLVTGGEPLLQKDAFTLIAGLCDNGYETLVETNGSIDLTPLHKRAVKIMDVKCPGSGESGSLYENNLLLLSKRDDLKFVVADRNDFLWALDLIKQRHLQEKTEIIFSPALPHLDPALLARWLIENGLTARLGLQLHKFIWPSAERGV